MPWSIVSGHDDCPSSESFGVIKDSDDSLVACHDTRESAADQIAALNAAESEEERSVIGRLFERIKEAFSEFINEPPDRAVSAMRIHEQLWATLDSAFPGEWPWLTDFFVDDDGSMFAVFASDGKLFRVGFTVENDEVQLGERQQVSETFTPVTSTRIIRQADGRHRWFSISATAVLNRVAEIDSRDLFDSFVAHSEETGEYPFRCFCHRGEQFRTGQADFLARDGDCYITSGLFDDSELAQMEIAARQKDPTFWGDSIGYNPTSEPEMVRINEVEIPVYRQGVNSEISTLPEGMAAAWFTTGSIMEVQMERNMGDLEFKAFTKLFDNDESKATAWLEENVDAANRAIKDREMVTRDAGDDDNDAEPTADPVESQVIELDDDMVSTIAGQVATSEALAALVEPLQASITALTATVEELSRNVGVQGNKRERAHSALVERLEVLETEETAKKSAWIKDLPARATQAIRITHRPSLAHAPQPNTDGLDLASVAEATTAKMNSRT